MSTELIQLIQDADLAMLDWENAKSQFEAAKLQVETAKEKADHAKANFESVVAQADAVGIPRSKLRKLVEERSQALLASGLFSQPANGATSKPPPAPKSGSTKATRKAKQSEPEVQDVQVDSVVDDSFPAVSEASLQ